MLAATMPSPAHGVDHYENFPVASLLCPPHLRPAVKAIYHFARTADDLADEGQASAAQRLAELDQFEADLAACATAQTSSSGRWPAVFDPLAPVLRDWNLPLDLLRDLLSAFKQDVTQSSYANPAQLLDYCRRSANPVGRLLLHLYQIRDETSLQHSDDICTALQLINFWQDLSVDLPRGRLYLPADLLARHGLSADQLLQPQPPAEAGALIEEAVQWAEHLMLRGAPLARRVPGRAGWELRLVVQGGLRIAQRVRRLGPLVLKQRPKLGRRDVALMAWRSLLMR
jgi:squalene synthase HpnC